MTTSCHLAADGRCSADAGRLPYPRPTTDNGGRGVVIGISIMYRNLSVHWACCVTAMQIFVSDDIAFPRGFVARLQISIKFKLW
jgi:hypothetical protein